MSKQKTSSNGKGDRNRVTNKEKFDKNWDRIFSKNKTNGEKNEISTKE